MQNRPEPWRQSPVATTLVRLLDQARLSRLVWPPLVSNMQQAWKHAEAKRGCAERTFRLHEGKTSPESVEGPNGCRTRVFDGAQNG